MYLMALLPPHTKHKFRLVYGGLMNYVGMSPSPSLAARSACRARRRVLPCALPKALCCPSPACRSRPEIAIIFRRGSRRPPEARQLVVPQCVAEVALEEIAAAVAHLAAVVGVQVPPESLCI